MADSALSRMDGLPVSIASLGLLYCKNDGVVGQDGKGLNLIDIAMLPLTPIVGNGTAPLQVPLSPLPALSLTPHPDCQAPLQAP